MRKQFALVLAIFARDAFAADASSGLDFFEKKIRPVLADRCYSCHSASAQTPMAGLLLDSSDGISRVVTAGDPTKSLLLSTIKREGKLKMPPTGPLADDQVADFEAWIKMG